MNEITPQNSRDEHVAARIRELEDALARAAYVAEHLFQMIDQETWRASGGDDQQGHYEGDYHALHTQGEIAGWKELANVR